MNLDPTRLDLNLLRVFDALAGERKVVAAAARLKLSAPAVSNALARLRRATGDELFTRSPGGMQPTSYAQTITPAIRQALAAIDNALTARAPFAAAHSARAFRVAMTDIGEIHFLPQLLRELPRSAPGVALVTVRDGAVNLREEMARGSVDLAVGWLPDLNAGFHQRRLFTQRYVCLMAKGNPLARGALTPARFLGARHVQASAEGTGHERVDKLLRRAGLTRELVLTVPNFVALPYIVAESDLVAIVPEVLAERTHQALKLVRRDVPAVLPSFEVNLFWHERVHRDAANQWLRDLVVRLFVA
jgi:DNA-binding transcriptional LysR family regulator